VSLGIETAPVIAHVTDQETVLAAHRQRYPRIAGGLAGVGGVVQQRAQQVPDGRIHAYAR